jgi:preprotein translocase subunit SecG
MFVLLTIVHVIVCVFLIIVVLLQSGKAADLAGAFGGMGSQTAFGPRGSATLLSKATTLSAIVFMITSMSLSILATRSSGVGKTVLDTSGAKQTAPAKPVTPPPKPSAPSGQPSVTLTPEGGGPSRTIPLKIPPAAGQKAPAQPARPKK